MNRKKLQKNIKILTYWSYYFFFYTVHASDGLYFFVV